MPPQQECPTIARKPPAPPSPPDEPPQGKPARAAAPPRRRAPPRSPAAGKLPLPPGTPRKKAVAAGPSHSAAPGEPAEAPRLETLQRVIVGSLEDDKAEAIVTLDLAGRASFADRMVIATGLADRQITAMATHLEEKLHARPGCAASRWRARRAPTGC